jgi:hypothetical protein
MIFAVEQKGEPMSLIDREALIAEYDRVHVGAPGGARKLMVDAPEVRPEPRWIPCSERMPNSNGCYLVWRPHFFWGERGMPAICYFDGQNAWHDSYGVDFERILHPDDVTAWMPLPEPYRKEEQDD